MVHVLFVASIVAACLLTGAASASTLPASSLSRPGRAGHGLAAFAVSHHIPGRQIMASRVGLRRGVCPLGRRPRTSCATMMASKDEQGEEEAGGGGGGEDWRKFRAKLVAQQKGECSGVAAEAVDLDEWIYDAGDVVEQGSVILGGTEMGFGFGLRQQYFHKVAILILSKEASFTRGIILNRPTSRTTGGGFGGVTTGLGGGGGDAEGKDQDEFRLWYGGDVQGISASRPNQEIVCLHTLSSPAAGKISINVMEGISWTTLDGALALVKAGEAKKEDFWVFSGYCGWGPGQIEAEIERGSWHVAAASSKVLLKGLLEQSKSAVTFEAGINVWETIMKKMGRKVPSSLPPLTPSDAKEWGQEYFDDCMLKEWSKVYLGDLASAESPIDALSRAVARRRAGGGGGTPPGTFLRATLPSEFVLSNQQFHKSVILVLQDVPEATIGVIVNRPTDVKLLDFAKSGAGRGGSSPRVFFGGEYYANEAHSFLTRIDGLEGGKRLGDSGTFVLDIESAIKAIKAGDVNENEMLHVRGLCIWPKGKLAQMEAENQKWKGVNIPEGGLQHEVDVGKFEEVQFPDECWQKVLGLSAKKSGLPGFVVDATDNSELMGVEVWASCVAKEGGAVLGRGQAADDDVVYLTETKRSSLADKALFEWCSAFIWQG